MHNRIIFITKNVYSQFILFLYFINLIYRSVDSVEIKTIFQRIARNSIRNV